MKYGKLELRLINFILDMGHTVKCDFHRGGLCDCHIEAALDLKSIGDGSVRDLDMVKHGEFLNEKWNA